MESAMETKYMMKVLLNKASILVVASLIAINLCYASDHIDGPATTGGSVTDLTDLFVFPSPDRPGYLVLIMDAHTFADDEALFSDVANYSFILRRATIHGTGPETVVETGEEFRFSCDFEAPHQIAGRKRMEQWGTCRGPSGMSIRVLTNDEDGAESSDSAVRMFAGLRSDPFYLNIERIEHVYKASELQFSNHGATNDLDGANALSIVLEVSIPKVFDSGDGMLLAVAAETTSKNGTRIDRVGRPEVTNTWLFDNVGDVKRDGDLDTRDLYNLEHTFSISGESIDYYRARMRANLAIYDMLDGKIDWPPGLAKAFVSLALNDFLIVDVTKPYNEAGYFEIERSILSGLPYATSGGRTLDFDTNDYVVTIMVNGGGGDEIHDGVARATQSGRRTFPYLRKPNVVMAQASASVNLTASSDEVWSKIGGFDSLSEWHPGVASTEMKDEGVGALRTVQMVDGLTFVEKLEKLEKLDGKGKSYMYSLVSGPLPVKNYEATFQIRDAANGAGCTVEWTANFQLNGAPKSPIVQVLEGSFNGGLENLEKIFGTDAAK